MYFDVKTTETHVTEREGRLAGDQFKALVIDTLKRELGISYQTDSFDLELTIGTLCMPTVWPDVHFSLTTDHLWHRKATPPHEQ